MYRTALPLVTLFTLVAPARAGQPVVTFEASVAQVTEGDAVTVTVALSGPATENAYVRVLSESNVAHSGVDFVPVLEDMYWEPGDGTSRQFDVQTIADDIPEGFEWFDLRFSGLSWGITFGEPSTMTIYISNDDGTGELVAWIGVEDAFEGGDGTYVFEAEAGTTFEIPVRLNTIPNPPVTVDYQSSFPPDAGTLYFSNSQEQTLYIDAPYPGELTHALGVLSISLSGGRAYVDGVPASRGGGVTSVRLVSILPPMGKFENCFYCWWTWLLHIRDPFFATCPRECWSTEFCDTSPRSAGTFDPNPILDALRRYRNEILTRSSAGLRFIDLYETYATDAGRALLRDPGIALELLDASQGWLGAVEALVDGQGDQVEITPAMQARLLTVISRMVDAGDSAFSIALDTERERLQLDAIIGLTMTELQDQVESLGNVPTRRTSWSEIKSRYR